MAKRRVANRAGAVAVLDGRECETKRRADSHSPTAIRPQAKPLHHQPAASKTKVFHCLDHVAVDAQCKQRKGPTNWLFDLQNRLI